MKNFTIKKIKKLSVVLALFLMTSALFAQMPAAIQVIPENATAFDELTLIFDPAEACFENGSLAGLPSIAIHSGVTLIDGSTWNFVVDFNSTGVNGQATTLEPYGEDKYSITYTPSEFYGIEAGTVVTQICAVFNNGTNWDQDGRDFNPNPPPECLDFFIPLAYTSTDPVFAFKLNMNKAINDGIFDPLEDDVYVDIEDFGATVLADPDLDNIYEATIEEGLTLDETYNYKFRINADVFEDILREITAVGGTTTVEAWWNNEAISQLTFIVNMFYQRDLGTFDPLVDFVDLAGSMNDWSGSGAMEEVDDCLYSVSYPLDAGVIYEYKFRINGDWATSEFPDGGPNRMIWGPNESKTITLIYDNYNPGTYPATFNVDMNTEITEGRFDPATDYLDIAGSMNGWGAYDVLFDRDWTAEGVYTIDMLIDTAFPFLEFKFRINGDWNNAEFPAQGPNRQWTVQDTAGGVVNLYECVYNIIDVPYAPYAYDLSIGGTQLIDEEITGAYTYFDPNGDAEGASIYRWFRSLNENGSDSTVIEGANTQAYTLTADDHAMYVFFEVTPVAATGDPSVGNPVHTKTGLIWYAGIEEPGFEVISIYPNPVNNTLYFENIKDVTKINIYNLIGQSVINLENINSENLNINTADLNKGIYFVVVYGNDNNSKTFKIIKK